MLRRGVSLRLAGKVSAVLAIFALTAAMPGAAQAVDYTGKRIQIIVPFSEGGGADGWARLLAPYLEKHLPGKPRVLILNRPGGGGITGANYFQERAAKDGTWAFVLSVSTALGYALHDPKFKTKFEDYHPVINSPRGSVLTTRKELGVQDVKTLKGKIEKLRNTSVEKLVMGGRTPTSIDLIYRVSLSLLGIEVKSVWGLGGGGPMSLAFERGEFTLMGENTLAFQHQRKNLLDSGIANPLYTWGNYDADGNYGRDPAMPDVPTFIEAYKAVNGKMPSGPGFEAWKALIGVDSPMNKSLLLHPDTPKDVVDAWVAAARGIIADKEFQQRAQKELGPYPQIIGKAILPIMKESFDIPPATRKWLAAYIKTRYDVTIPH